MHMIRIASAIARTRIRRLGAAAVVLAVAAAARLGAEVGVTDGPKGVVVNTRNGKAYAAFPDFGIVKIVNGTTGAVVVLPTGANVKDLSIDPRDGRVYAMNRGPGTISVIDPDRDAIIDTLKADRGSLTALNPVTNQLYVSASTGTEPSVIDLGTKQSTVIHAGTEGNALSVNVKANKIYFVGYEDNFLTIVDGATNQPTRITMPGFHQWDSAFNETTGQLYLPTPNDDAVTVVDTRTNVVSTIGTGSVPIAAAVNEVTNRLYVVNYGSSDVTVIDTASNRPMATVKVGLWPQQIAINTKTNTIYVVNTHANSVSVIDGRTNTLAATVPTDKGPWAIAVNPATNMIYVANRLSDKVTVIDGRTNTAVQR
jgi:YVTN family beta-propeller protein